MTTLSKFKKFFHLRPENIPECRGGEKPGAPPIVVDHGDGEGGVPHLVVHDGVHKHRHAVLRQDLNSGAYKKLPKW